jgi:type III restriction enzyme
LRDILTRCIHELVINKLSYELQEIRIATALTDKSGQLLKTIGVHLCGKEEHAMSNPAVHERSLFENTQMPVDSQIERDTVDQSNHAQITVFAKLPPINIPTPVGNYNPDFGYALTRCGQAQALYLVVETKGYDAKMDIPEKERWKIESAQRFFEALQAQGLDVKFRTRINTESLGQIIQEMGIEE